MEEIVNSAGKLRYISGGQFAFPLVVISTTGAGWGVGAQHNHNLEAWFVHSPGLKVVMPSTADDFRGLLKAAIRDENPVMFFTDMTLDRKSTRLNSSHANISYAVFCLKKKNEASRRSGS